ncbi:hypothetical protein [Aestuariibaculum marinum]|uniref:Uncharacterized protein n=1 Tax=Aestuariibaculum marinum TaxID=2683592 RepID=A0A8J6U463_9FLAO|nr:hypothetical protein [Aestuariibaculum marinum]MBD0822629.1 hypothetical protein [Aestuariibaculum marinum]
MEEIFIPFSIGQTVYFKTDEEQRKHLVTGIIIRKTGIIIEVSDKGLTSEVYDFELTAKENILIKMGIEPSED